MNRRFALTAILSLSIVIVAAAEPSPGDKVLQRLRALQGSWEGTLEWSGARTGNGPVKATYLTTGNGSAVIENLTMGGDANPSMTSVYHLDGADLRMTHYCGAHNQPRLRATQISPAADAVAFSFVDATDLAAHPAHVEGCELRFVDDDHLVVRFTFTAGGKKSVENIDLKRVR
ncbi:MAG: hypothetical protein ACXVJT_10645 [Thermoanaerobaculia bacterium]